MHAMYTGHSDDVPRILWTLSSEVLDHFLIAKRGNIFPREPGFEQNLFTMLAEFRRGSLHIDGSCTQSDWVADNADLTNFWMIHLGNVAVGERLFIVKNVFVFLHRCDENIDLGQQLHPFFSCLVWKYFIQEFLDFCATKVADDVVAKFWISKHVLDAHDTTEIRPAFIIDPSEAEPTIFGFERAP